MKALIKNHASKFRFALVGGVNTLIDFGVLFLLHGLGLDKILANYASTSVALVFSFFANKSYTFRSISTTTPRQFTQFLIITLVGLWVIQPVIIGGLTAVLDTALHNDVALLVAKLVATGASLTWNYLLYSRFVFTPKEKN